ncbi:hypothetical protein F5884DRAFT_803479 [Xylogone sp. PMI_703]|nr:hypothetical protein F5884DRAFT_803479 [Xylogone sp. PMI_703]
MDESPLTLAHDHARAAALATHTSDTTVAISEHTLAAGEFAKAATGTGSTEALRVLRLLEQHHQKLSALLRDPVGTTTAAAPETEVQVVEEKPAATTAPVAELPTSKSDIGARSSSPVRSVPSLPQPRRLPARELSSSIASNLASARGIRSNYVRQPLSPSVSRDQAPGNLEVPPRLETKRSRIPSTILEEDTKKPSWTPPTQTSPKSKETSSPSTQLSTAVATAATSRAQQQESQTTETDEGFSKFYNVFENILYKLSAPLAFAGLPLASEEESTPVAKPEPSPVTPAKSRSRTREERLGPEPDVSKYISRAALRATARDGGNDSFYVVPTTGHTVSYAHILSYADKERRRMAASLHSNDSGGLGDTHDDDDFVDARETQLPDSPGLQKRFGGKKRADKGAEHVMEELFIENVSLKDCIDKLSKRLHTFEMSAQNSTLALHESMRLLRPQSPAGVHGQQDMRGGPGPGDEVLKKRVLEMEDQLNAMAKDMEKLEKENEKLRNVVGRYRERWEKLKEGAKSRREGVAAASKDPSSSAAADG